MLPRVQQVQGTVWRLTVVWQDPEDRPIDLTRATVVGQVRARWADEAPGPPLLELTVGDGLTVPVPTAGVVEVEIAAERTDAWPWGLFRCELRVDHGGGPARLVAVDIEVAAAVVRRSCRSCGR